MGIEPTSSAWEAEVLPLNYTRPDDEPIGDVPIPQKGMIRPLWDLDNCRVI